MNRAVFLTFASLLSCASPAAAASSDWAETQGGKVRLVTEAPQPDGSIRAVLEIDLDPGWKTYWRDPGDAGVPPQVGLAAGSGYQASEIAFPPPSRFDDGYSVFAGYDHDVALPFTIRPVQSNAGDLVATVFLGICETICVPLSAELSIAAPALAEADADEIALVEAAFVALPEPAGDALRVEGVTREGQEALVSVRVAEEAAEPELFVAGAGSTMVGLPHATGRDGGLITFAMKILSSGKDADPVSLPYVIVTEGRSVEGELTLPAE